MNAFFFGIYPYIALAIFFLGSLVRFEREQYTWKTDSSQLLHRGNLRLGSNLFHIGIISLFFTHLVGLLTPKEVYHAFGLTTEAKQLMAIVGGTLLGIMCFIGMLILIHRRMSNARIAAVTKPMDKFLYLWLFATLCLGLISIVFSLDHLDGHVMVLLGMWAQKIVTLQGSDAAVIITGVPTIYKIHMFMGMTLFVIFPFTRLVHVWSGFGAVTYLSRAWQLVRTR